MSTILLIIAAFALAGLIQGVIGFGFAVATTLLLFNQINFTSLVFLNLIISFITALIAMLSGKNLKAINKPVLTKLVITAFAGLVIGILLLDYTNVTILKKITLSVILIASILSLTNSKAYFAHNYVVWISGFFSGLLTPSTGINGPLVALHLNAVFKDKQQIRTTMLAFLLLIMGFGVLSMVIKGKLPADTWSLFAKVIVPSVVGYVIGLLSFKLLANHVFQRIVTLFLISSSLASLIYLII